MKNILPDSRAKRQVDAIRTSTGTMIPVYCANCGVPHGRVPDELITHVFALCNKCLEKHGDLAHTYVEPETAFWEKLENAMKEENITTPEEIQLKLLDPSSSFSKLAKEWDQIQARGRV